MSVITPRLIARVVAESFGFDVADLSAPGRHAGRTRARQIAIALSVELTPASYAELARTFGRQSKAGAYKSMQRVDYLASRDAWWRDSLNGLRERIRAHARH